MSRTGRDKGLTLLELLAVLGIVAVLLALTLPAMNIFRSQSDVKYAAKAIEGILQEARSMAVAKGENFTVKFDLTEGSCQIFDQAGNPVSKKWLAGVAVQITQINTSDGDPELDYKPNGGTDTSASVYLKRRDADAGETDKYYTLTVVNSTGACRVYPYKN